MFKSLSRLHAFKKPALMPFKAKHSMYVDRKYVTSRLNNVALSSGAGFPTNYFETFDTRPIVKVQAQNPLLYVSRFSILTVRIGREEDIGNP